MNYRCFACPGPGVSEIRHAAIPAVMSIRGAARTMVNGGFRQLPVADSTGRLGIIDIADVCGAHLLDSRPV